MLTIKAMIVEKLRQKGRSVDDCIVRGKVKQFLNEICELLPDETPVGQEFARSISDFEGEWHAKAVKALIEKAMDEHDDLGGKENEHLRQKLVTAIENWR